jgi:hypothetical protein
MESIDRDEKILCKLKIGTWNNFLTWVFLLNFSLMVTGLVTPRWVRQGSRDTLWRGSLMRCGGCIGDWEDQYYLSISQTANEHNVKGYYKTFNSLFKSGLIYLIFEVLCILLMSLILVLKLKVIKNSLSRRFFLIIHTLISVFHTVGTISWFSISQAKFFYTCSKSSDYFTEASICATNGPVISIVIEFLLILNIILQILVNKRTIPLNSIVSSSSSRLEKVIITTDNMINYSK